MIDAFGKTFFVDDGAKTLQSYVVELCGEVSVSETHPALNALYILGYEVLNQVISNHYSMASKKSERVGLGFKQADADFNASSMFT
jgi:hypothetical protein